MTREERRAAAKPRMDLNKAVAKSIHQFVYEFDDDLYTHYVDARDACMPWSPSGRLADAMGVAIYHGFSIQIDKGADDSMAVAITRDGEVLAMQEGRDSHEWLVAQAICLAAAKTVGFEPEQK